MAKLPAFPNLRVTPMYQQNLSSKFKTSRGSIYEVVPHDVIRYKYDDPDHPHVGSGKNIYFVAKSVASEILKHFGTRTEGKVYPGSDAGTYTLQYKVPGDGGTLDLKTYIGLSQIPAVGLSPLDMILRSDGSFASQARFHVGDKITEVL